MKKRTIIMSAAIVASAGVAALGTVGVTNAASAMTTHHAGLVKRVNGARGEAKLTQAVRDGVITQAQKDAFVTEAKALRTERKAAVNKDSTKAEREAEHTKLKTELKAWATTNNFPLAKIFPKLAE